MEMGMGVMTGRELWFFLGVVRGLRMRMVQGMVLIQFFLPGLVRADISARGCLGIIRPTIRAVSGCHNQYSPPVIKTLPLEPDPKRSDGHDAGNRVIFFIYAFRVSSDPRWFLVRRAGWRDQ
jgi:hypothetical protein